MGIIWNDPSVQAAAIQAIGGILAATIAAVGAVVVGKRFLAQKRLLEKLSMMRADLNFLLAVENEHCKRNGQKILVRNSVRDRGMSWSGRFTPSRTLVYQGKDGAD